MTHRILSLPPRFLDPLDSRWIDGKNWQLLHRFEYRVGSADSDVRVAVPAGFVTDFASVPQILWNILPPTGPYGPAAVLHDYLYRFRNIVRVHNAKPDPPYIEYLPLCSRQEADDILLEAMQVLRVPYLTHQAVYLGVRIGGCYTWERYRAIDHAKAADSDPR